MRVLQLIDSLNSGGAEQMSLTYANALAKRIDGSFLCCTRKEGLLKKKLAPEVGYLFLDKKISLDFSAFLRLRKFVVEKKVDLIQAHSSSWFLALMVKLSLPGLKLVWHDHYGRDLKKRKAGILKQVSRYFVGIISVNADLKKWAEETLACKKVIFFRNFLPVDNQELDYEKNKFLLEGTGEFKIICLANLRPQKDHLNLLQAFEKVQKDRKKISLHLVGKEEENSYSRKLRSFVQKADLQENVFFYGEHKDVHQLLLQADLGVLSSASEGLPLALLEYGRAGLPVICTEVGECPEVIGNSGVLVPPGDPMALSDAISSLIKNREKRKAVAENFQQKILKEYSEKKILSQVLNFFEEILVK